MAALLRQSDFRSVQNLLFCYLCGRDFVAGDRKNRDHVPPECIFAPLDREPLWLPAHTACNSSYRLLDEKIGQLIALRYGKVPSNPAHRRLRFAYSPHRDLGAPNMPRPVATVRRRSWIVHGASASYPPFARAVAAALSTRALALPKPRIGRSPVVTIRSNRVRGNLDRIVCNKGKLTYECVWQRADNGGPWMCIFALDIYDWKDLGRTSVLPARGCAGFYLTPARTVPANATRALASSIIVPSSDRLDAFAP